jgi:transposase
VSLSDRDERIARLLARGHTRRDIAERVGCSERTVYTVLQNPDVMELAAQVREEQGALGRSSANTREWLTARFGAWLSGTGCVREGRLGTSG